jgi:hypothetical protein
MACFDIRFLQQSGIHLGKILDINDDVQFMARFQERIIKC